MLGFSLTNSYFGCPTHLRRHGRGQAHAVGLGASGPAAEGSDENASGQEGKGEMP